MFACAMLACLQYTVCVAESTLWLDYTVACLCSKEYFVA
jgi:hypothetical protein